MGQRKTQEEVMEKVIDNGLGHVRYARNAAVVCFVFHILFSLCGWNNSILDHFGFRQSQTAITSYYFMKDGYKIDYEIPVFGPPWRMPSMATTPFADSRTIWQF